jgi:hypothetical protein
MVQLQQSRRIARSRKPHICAHCGSTIPTGSPYLKRVGLSVDGDFYSDAAHEDCAALWSEAFDTYGDWEYGMPWDLCEAIEPDESREFVQSAYNHYRGRYPHVICRLEFRWQRGDIDNRERLRALGREPDPEDYPEVYG